jgi:hypothetical protein
MPSGRPSVCARQGWRREDELTLALEQWDGKTSVTFAVEMHFDFDSGQPAEWQRLRNANFE